jgi:hypothetical protein
VLFRGPEWGGMKVLAREKQYNEYFHRAPFLTELHHPITVSKVEHPSKIKGGVLNSHYYPHALLPNARRYDNYFRLIVCPFFFRGSTCRKL